MQQGPDPDQATDVGHFTWKRPTPQLRPGWDGLDGPPALARNTCRDSWLGGRGGVPLHPGTLRTNPFWGFVVVVEIAERISSLSEIVNAQERR